MTRWGGRLTSRPLPDDESIAELDAGAREVLAASWLMRAAAERRAADIFTLIDGSLRALQEQPTLIELAQRSVDDEHRHSEICRLVASRYAGRSLSFTPLALDPPAHEGASEDLRHSLWIIGQCAFNETFASAFLDASLEQSRAPLAHAALRQLLSDEIDHARIGWAHLASVSAARRGDLARFIPRMLAAYRDDWSHAAGADTDAYAAHGLISKASIAHAISEAEREVIRPGLARHTL